MTTLHLGVVDLPYVLAKNGKDANTSTGDVASFLEEDYGIMAFFVENNADVIQSAVEESLQVAIDNIVAGAPMASPLDAACGTIESRFRQFLDNREMDGKVPGVATEASLNGYSNRFKDRKSKKGKGRKRVAVSRPSFIDSGQYQASFKVWSE